MKNTRQHKREKKQMSEYAQSQGISVTNTCYDCALVSEYSPEYKCITCVEDKEGRDDAIAYELVDEGNMQYGDTMWSRIDDLISGHDWIGSNTVSRVILDDDNNEIDYVMRLEYTPPIVQLVDGGVLDNLWELEDYTQYQRETECKWCNLLTPKMFNDCQACDKPLENNL